MWIQAAELRPSLQWAHVTGPLPSSDGDGDGDDAGPAVAAEHPAAAPVPAAAPTTPNPLAPLLDLVDAHPLSILGAKVPLAAAEYGLKVEGMALLGNGEDTLCVIKAWAFPAFNLPLVIRAADACPLSHFSLVCDPHPYYLERVFWTLGARAPPRSLLYLHEPETAQVPHIVEFLKSPRSFGLETLFLPGRCLTPLDLSALVDTVRDYNPTLAAVTMCDCRSKRVPACVCHGRETPEGEAWDRQVRRLAVYLERNGILTARVRRAAVRALVIARVIANGRSGAGSAGASSTCAGPAEEAAAAAELAHPFRLLDLPRDVHLKIIRDASADPLALTEQQWATLIAHAEAPGSLARLAAGMREAQVAGVTFPVALAEWLGNGAFWWKHRVPVVWRDWTV
ncbi:hypothetical protein Q8F55_005414 [Vanrija albida]|uniref:Uncharacterized protein n=1 Tax=Vanrija albida TaxID=181172 RepID=A0ABR3Q2B7_9TREE